VTTAVETAARPKARAAAWGDWVWPFLAHEALVGLAALWPLPAPSVRVLRLNMAFFRHAWGLVQYDALWFLEIARHGYRVPHVPPLTATVFFPWLPLVLHVTGQVGGLVVQQAVLAAVCWLLGRRFRRWGLDRAETRRAVWLFALNPALVYYSSLYAEGWTLLAFLASLEAADRRRFAGAGAAGAVAALTQAPGLLVGAVPLAAWAEALYNRQGRNASRFVLWGAGAALGLGLYMVYLGIRFHAPLLFASMERSAYWDSVWQWPWVGWLGPLVAADPGAAWGADAGPTLAILVGVTLLLVGAARGIPLLLASRTERWRKGLVLYTVVGVMLSLSFGSAFSLQHSTLRLLSLYFPAYAGLAHRVSRPAAVLLIGLSAGVGWLGATLFTHGWFFQ
jgi:hypothetical protein